MYLSLHVDCVIEEPVGICLDLTDIKTLSRERQRKSTELKASPQSVYCDDLFHENGNSPDTSSGTVAAGVCTNTTN